MSIEIKEVKSKRDLKAFIRFFTHLYSKNVQVAFPLHFDEYKTLAKGKNPAHEHCKTQYWLAYENGRVVGRIAAIINLKEIEKTGKAIGRFGWFDFVNKTEVSSALMEAACQWLRKHEIENVHGPLGFSDLDRQGALVEGFENPGTMATIYNYPYYHAHFEKLGFAKSTDWIEYEIKVADGKVALLKNIALRTARMNKCYSLKPESRKELKKYSPQIFRLINESYSDLYGCIPLDEEQIKFYTEAYLSFVRLELISLICSEDGKLIGVGITMPSFTKALQQTKGKLFPLGFLKLLKALRTNDKLDLYLIAVDREYQGKGVNAMIMNDIVTGARKIGIKSAETNIELEDNHKVQSMWRILPGRLHKRRRCYKKTL